MPINKNTKIFCSFSKNAGNKGCEFFNRAFSDHNVDAIYKSFSVDNIEDAIRAAKTLKFSGCAVAMPYKKIVYGMVDVLDQSAIKSKSVNTVIFDHDKDLMTGYNTDYYGANKILLPLSYSHNVLYVLGNGGLSGAVQAAGFDLGFKVNVITRDNWSDIDSLQNSLIYNCTPLTPKINESNSYVDCIVGTVFGDLLHKHQSHKQFELYTGITIK
jgi:shikimate dehydrogenase